MCESGLCLMRNISIRRQRPFQSLSDGPTRADREQGRSGERTVMCEREQKWYL